MQSGINTRPDDLPVNDLDTSNQDVGDGGGLNESVVKSGEPALPRKMCTGPFSFQYFGSSGSVILSRREKTCSTLLAAPSVVQWHPATIKMTNATAGPPVHATQVQPAKIPEQSELRCRRTIPLKAEIRHSAALTGCIGQFLSTRSLIAPCRRLDGCSPNATPSGFISLYFERVFLSFSFFCLGII